MIAKMLKSENSSFWSDIQYVGLIEAGAHAVSMKLTHGGRYSLQISDPPFSGQAELLVHCGGLRKQNIPAKVKELFREEIMPVLVEAFPEVIQKFSGKIVLHYREGLLTTFNLAH